MFTSYFAADEAETLDAIYRNDADAIAGMSSSLVLCMRVHADDILHLSCYSRIRKDREGAHNSYVCKHPCFRTLF